MSKYPTALNADGQDHVGRELERIGLDWDVQATCDSIEQTVSFSEVKPGSSDRFSYEISNIAVGKSGYGIFATIEIDADQHVRFETVENELSVDI